MPRFTHSDSGLSKTVRDNNRNKLAQPKFDTDSCVWKCKAAQSHQSIILKNNNNFNLLCKIFPETKTTILVKGDISRKLSKSLPASGICY